MKKIIKNISSIELLIMINNLIISILIFLDNNFFIQNFKKYHKPKDIVVNFNTVHLIFNIISFLLLFIVLELIISNYFVKSKFLFNLEKYFVVPISFFIYLFMLIVSIIFFITRDCYYIYLSILLINIIIMNFKHYSRIFFIKELFLNVTKH